MKYIKLLGLLAVAAAALTAFAATASATTITSPTGTVYTGNITAESSNTSLDGSFVTVSCPASHVEAKVEQHGAGVTVKGKILKLSFGPGCVNGTPTVKTLGSLELHAVNSAGETCTAGAGDTCTGTLTSNGTVVVVHTSVGECGFETNGTHIGTLTPTPDTKGTAVLDINSSKIPRVSGNFLCGSSATWTGNYTVSTPMELWIDEN